MTSVMQHQFSRVPSADIPRSSFDRSHGHKTTLGDAGILYPIFVDEALPGDTFNMNPKMFIRMSTPIFPLMDYLYADLHWFSVPIRQVWDNFRKFMGERFNPTDSIDFIEPTMNSTATTGYAEGSIYDYLGIPPGVPDLEHRAVFLRAIAHVYNEWFRDQNLQDSIPFNKDDGPDTPTDYQLYPRTKRHDYFTSALPWPQKGDDVFLPLGTSAPVLGIGSQDAATYSTVPVNVHETDATTARQYTTKLSNSDTVNLWYLQEDPSNPGFPNVRVDLTRATSATVNQYRESFQIQKLLERDARSGTRYSEIVNAHFGVNFMDVTYRPEYLGGHSVPINMTEVPSTVPTDIGTTPQGNLAAFATASMNGGGFTKSFFEHCIILGFVSIRADLTYQQGLERMWSRSTRYDHYWPALAHLGEQEILSKEIYAQGSADPDDESVFGYQERWAEYRYKPSRISGAFRSASPTSLDAWHLSQEFGARPLLNDVFIQEDPPMDRVVSVPSEPKFICDAYFNLNCVRPMPLYSVPGLIDHF